MQYFVNKTVWITGASSGIGEALAYEFAKKGARLLLSARNEDELKRVRSQCVAADLHQIIQLDLEKFHDMEAKAEEVWSKFGPIDIIVNNAGVSQRYLGLEATVALDQMIMNTNFFGPVALTRPIVRHMKKINKGQIAVVSSVLGLYGIQTRTAYSASKHALRGYFESLRNELFQTQIKFTLIYPGYIRTKISQNAISAEGKPYGKEDEGFKKGISAEDCAVRIVHAIQKGHKSAVIGGPKELIGVYIARYFPGLFHKLSARTKV